MSSKVRGVVFDLDGTLVDSRGDIAASANVALAEAGFPTLSIEAISPLIGDGSRTLLARAAKISEGDPRVDRLLATFVAWYQHHPIGATALYLHSLEVLFELGDFPRAICTNKAHRVAVAVLDAFGVTALFRSIVGGDSTPTRKPAPEPLLLVAQELGLRPDELVMIGDGPQDVLAGKAVGARTIAVLEGAFLPRERMLETNPDAIVASLGEVAAVVRKWT